MAKKKLRLYFLFLSAPLRPIIFSPRLHLRRNPSLSLHVALKRTINNTGWFFKKIAFIGLAYLNITQKTYRVVTMKSVMASLWNMIAAHANIF